MRNFQQIFAVIEYIYIFFAFSKETRPVRAPANRRIGLIHLLAGWHKRPLNQYLVSLGLVLLE